MSGDSEKTGHPSSRTGWNQLFPTFRSFLRRCFYKVILATMNPIMAPMAIERGIAIERAIVIRVAVDVDCNGGSIRMGGGGAGMSVRCVS